MMGVTAQGSSVASVSLDVQVVSRSCNCSCWQVTYKDSKQLCCSTPNTARALCCDTSETLQLKHDTNDNAGAGCLGHSQSAWQAYKVPPSGCTTHTLRETYVRSVLSNQTGSNKSRSRMRQVEYDTCKQGVCGAQPQATPLLPFSWRQSQASLSIRSSSAH